jgi:uncharacterized protein YjbJ (UPF0337 family)
MAHGSNAVEECAANQGVGMDWNVIERNWEQYRVQVKAQWTKLTNDNVTLIAGRRDQVAGQIQESYGVLRDEADRQIAAFQKYLKDSRPS